MADFWFILIYFFYGLAFFSMGLVVALEGDRSSDPRLRHALQPLWVFGVVHAAHEWLEMVERIGPLLGLQFTQWGGFYAFRLVILAFSFLSLAAFGSYLIAKTKDDQRVMLLIPIGLVAVWVFGMLMLRGNYSVTDLWDVVDTWTRYSLGIPASLLAAVGLIYQQRAFRRSGLVRFGQDALWAAVAFGWYGLIGQFFVHQTALPPSTILNENLFLSVVGIPIQLVRAAAAVIASLFVIRFLRAFQVEVQHQIAVLQTERLAEAQEREELRGELFRRVVAAQESERQRIARDLHDETGQSLTAIGLGLRGLSNTIQHRNSDQAVTTLRQLESLAANSLTELQRLISDLRPSHLDDLGLPAALRWYAGTVQERTHLKISVEFDGEARDVDPTVKIALFRVTQEALNNIIKHASASTVVISLECRSADVHLTIKDDGRGFDPQAVQKNKGRVSLGLIGMRERATLLGGTCAVTSISGRGTLVDVSVPYHPREEKQ